MFTIGLDFDGVIGNCDAMKSKYAKELYGVEITPAELTREKVASVGLVKTQYRTIQKTIYADPVIGLQMPPIPNALVWLQSFCNNPLIRVKIITSRDGPELAIALDWLTKHGFGSQLKSGKLTVVGVGYGVDKTKAALDVDAFVDDDLNKLTPLNVKYKFLFDPYLRNNPKQLPKGIIQVQDWGVLSEYLIKYANNQCFPKTNSPTLSSQLTALGGTMVSYVILACLWLALPIVEFGVSKANLGERLVFNTWALLLFVNYSLYSLIDWLKEKFRYVEQT